MSANISIDEYLEKVSRFTGSEYGRIVREQFADTKGTSELGMLASPTAEELEQLRRAVGIMTADEKTNAADLTDEQIHKIAADSKVDPGLLAIFLNGFALHHKKHC
ncbi:MAG: hypothetical protein JW749_04895 [Sedimentisphaerales bacterium]|nr:hypothetical protein [Sedimentisphaerales bacterium]